MRRRLSYVLALGFVALLFGAPLPFGGVTPWASAWIESSCWLLLSVAVLFRGRWTVSSETDTASAGSVSSPVLTGRLHQSVPIVALLALAALGFIQAVPWSANWVRSVSSEHAVAWQAAAELVRPIEGLSVTGSGSLAEGDGRAAVAGEAYLSFAPDLSLKMAWRLLALAALTLAAILAGASVRVGSVVLLALMGSGLLQAAFGFMGWLERSSSIWGVEVPNVVSRLRGSFVNPNHAALFLELSLAAATAMLLLQWSAVAAGSQRRDRGTPGGLLAWRPRPWSMFSALVMVWLVLWLALLLTASRAAVLAALVATLAQVLVVWPSLWRSEPGGFKRRSSRLLAVCVIALGAAGLAATALFGRRHGLTRLSELSPYELLWNDRVEVYRRCLDLVTDYPFLGTGLGSFSEVFPAVQSESIGHSSWRHAHNDWLELVVTGGAVSGGIALLASGWLWASFYRRSRPASALNLGSQLPALCALGALTSVALHEVLDFGLTMPANAVTLAVVVGLGLAEPRRGQG